ncbi:MAG: SGNH/GDSL hydrolase family protein [Candidatus Hydrogenedentes bacterium]|nr:SGNH/GDSL hydrolase family protein [Candidatus Hydrogenedentota bacterium]
MIMRVVKRLMANAALVLVSCVVALLLLEGALRLFFYGSLKDPSNFLQDLVRIPDPVLGWVLKPGGMAVMRTLDFVQVVKYNSNGSHDIEKSYEPAPGVFRVVVLGDSFIEGAEVGLEECLPRRLEKLLAGRKVEVINLGVTGYGTGQCYLTLREKGLKYKPDLVILAVYAENDIRNDCHQFERIIWGAETYADARPYPVWKKDGSIDFTPLDFDRIVKEWDLRSKKRRDDLQHRRFYQRALLYSLIPRSIEDPLTAAFDLNVLFGVYLDAFDSSLPHSKLRPDQYDLKWQEAWKKTEALIQMTCDLARRNGVQFLLMSMPSKIEADPNALKRVKQKFPQLKLNLEKANVRLQAIADRIACPFLNLLPAFRQHYQEGGKPLFYSYQDRHWNKLGHKLASENLAAFLDQKRLVPPVQPEP